ncbi:MAG: hypothetical protein ABWU16_00040 [Halothiobacillaceae bacterium]
MAPPHPLPSVCDLDGLEARPARMVRAGVPNGSDEQRFGHRGSKLEAVRAWFADGKLRLIAASREGCSPPRAVSGSTPGW